MTNSLKIAFVQDQIHWCNWQANENQYNAYLNLLKDAGTDLLVLPEMFASGFVMEPQKGVQTMQGPAVEWMLKNSDEFAICGSLAIVENGLFYNRFIWCEKGKVVHTYDKRHLFSYSGEHLKYTAGKTKVLIQYKDWKIEPFICYDLRFPVWCRSSQQADLLIFSANWPQKRIQVWQTLLKARAIENACYALGVNRIGEDGNGLYYSGYSVLNNWLGEPVTAAEESKGLFTCMLNKTELVEYRKSFPVLGDADTFYINL